MNERENVRNGCRNIKSQDQSIDQSMIKTVHKIVDGSMKMTYILNGLFGLLIKTQ